MTPIAAAIGLLRPRVVVEPAFRAAGPWERRFDAFPHVKIGGVVRGSCWLTLQDQPTVLLREGDFYLLGNPGTYALSSAPGHGGAPSKGLSNQNDVAGERKVPDPGGVPEPGMVPDKQADTYLCAGQFLFDDANAAVLMDVLPALVHVRAGDPRGTLLMHISELVVAEVDAGEVGKSLVLDHLAQIMFVQMLRAHAAQTAQPTGWLRALADDGVGAALRAMHADVAHRWSLAELAGISHMSRSAFATTFKAQVGTPPLDYLISWRISLARDALRQGTSSISELAAATGYESESAFSTAFRRVVGHSPRQFRDTQRIPASSSS